MTQSNASKFSGSIGFEIPPLFPAQIKFFKSNKKFTLYGGARGGGKSFIVRYKAISLALKFRGINILILRRTFPELEENHIKHFKRLLKGIATYSEKKNKFVFPNGSEIKFGYCKTDSDVDQYQGHEYQAIFLDEATHFTFNQFTKLSECLRLSSEANVFLEEYPNFKPRMYLTANPGGVGHLWVKRLFIDKIYENEEDPEDYDFIPALVFENTFIMENDPTYLKMLKALPEKERQAMLYGDWNVFSGQFFDEFDEAIHTYDEFEVDAEGKYIYAIQPQWRIYRTRDYGLDKTACYWIAMDEDGSCYVYRELWESNLVISQSGNKINSMTLPNETIYLDLCPPDMWNRQRETGHSSIDILMRDCHQYPTKANNDREIGWLMVKEFLKINPNTNRPRLMISKSCVHLIESLRMIQHDEKKVNDCASQPHEVTHSCDALRYFCTSYTYAPDRVVLAAQNVPYQYGRFALNIGEYEESDTTDYDDDEYGMNGAFYGGYVI